jgi:hypothetical protein
MSPEEVSTSGYKDMQAALKKRQRMQLLVRRTLLMLAALIADGILLVWAHGRALRTETRFSCYDLVEPIQCKHDAQFTSDFVLLWIIFALVAVEFLLATIFARSTIKLWGYLSFSDRDWQVDGLRAWLPFMVFIAGLALLVAYFNSWPSIS